MKTNYSEVWPKHRVLDHYAAQEQLAALSKRLARQTAVAEAEARRADASIEEVNRLRSQVDALSQALLTPDVFSQLSEWLADPSHKRASDAFTAGIERQIAYALEIDVLPLVKRQAHQIKLLREALANDSDSQRIDA